MFLLGGWVIFGFTILGISYEKSSYLGAYLE